MKKLAHVDDCQGPMLAAIKKIMYYDVFSLDAILLIANCETSFCYMGGLLPVPSGPAPRAWGTYQIVSQVYSSCAKQMHTQNSRPGIG